MTIICLVLGSFILLYGLISLLVKERLYLSESLVAALVGILIGPHALNLLQVFHTKDHHTIEHAIFQFSRIAIGIQVMFAGVELPAKYIKWQWKSLAMLLGPCMISSWLATSAMIRYILGIDSLIIGSCVAPTDPVLANGIVRGKFAERIPVHVRDIISAESGANDGLGFPFLFIALLIKLEPPGNEDYGHAVLSWLVVVVLYQVLFSCVLGALIGAMGKRMLWYAKKHKLIDKESFLTFAISLAIFTIGAVGILESDDLLACFVAGNYLNWDDQFRKSIESEHIQSVFDNLINLSFFVFFGATFPWSYIGASAQLATWKMVVLGVAVMLFRRLPIVFILHRWIPVLVNWKEALFVGWFGPIGVSGLFYAYLLTHYHAESGVPSLVKLAVPIVSFLVLTSLVVHGITVPIIKLSTSIKKRKARRKNQVGSDGSSKHTHSGSDGTTEIEHESKEYDRGDGVVIITEEVKLDSILVDKYMQNKRPS
ncbi:Cation/H+ exchanger [Paraphysoderma sedebokerense]|nr:Cation/H+ exchanger [Paraphysoderma sedebokerense]